LKMLIRTWRGGDLGLILWSLVLAVAVVTSVSLLAERIDRALTKESSSFLAADLVVRSSKEAPLSWLREAENKGVNTAKMMSFPSIVFYGDDLHLASIKAVQASYPLRGSLKRSKIAFTRDESLIESVAYGPSKGEVWVDSRLLPLLNVGLGDEIELGDASLKITYILVEEPDGSSYSFIGARVLMNYADIPASGVIQPGSRVTYRYLMAADKQDNLDSYKSWLEPQLDVHDRLITPDQAQASISDTLDKGRRFLLLAGSIGVVLAGIALALASHHFASGQTKQVALLKRLGNFCKPCASIVPSAELMVRVYWFDFWITRWFYLSLFSFNDCSGMVAYLSPISRCSAMDYRFHYGTSLFGWVYSPSSMASPRSVSSRCSATGGHHSTLKCSSKAIFRSGSDSWIAALVQ
jgi:putative ABC transport system permease protein